MAAKCFPEHAMIAIGLAFGIAFGAAFPALGRDCGNGSITSGGERGRFHVFDATLYRNKPDLSAYGIEPIIVHYGEMWKGPQRYQYVPDDETIAALVRGHPVGVTPVVLDVEMWPVRGVADGEIDASLSKLRLLLSRFKSQDSARPIGLYSLLPLRDYWRAVNGPSSPGYQSWQRENDRVVVLDRSVDALFPSIYTFYDDQDGWRKYAIAQVSEARRMSKKPVYAFVWPEYHDSNKTLAGTFIDPGFWRAQLDLLCAIADGVVIWGGYDTSARHPRSWDENAPWWSETKDFMKRLGAVRE